MKSMRWRRAKFLVQIEKQLLYLLPGHVKKVTKRPKLFEFLRDTNREELSTKNTTSLCNGFPLLWPHFAMILLYNGYVAFKNAVCKYITSKDVRILSFIASPVRLCLQTKLPSFLTTGYTGKYHPSSRTSQPMKVQH